MNISKTAIYISMLEGKLKEAKKEIAELRGRNIQIANWCNEQTGEIRRQQSDIKGLKATIKIDVEVINDKDAGIKELAEALKEAADDIRDWGVAFRPRAITNKRMMSCCDKYRAIAKGEK